MARSPFRSWSGPLAGFAAGFLFLVLLFAFQIALVVAAGLALATFVGFLLVLIAVGSPARSVSAGAPVPEGWEADLQKAEALVRRIRALGQTAVSASQQASVSQIADVSSRILEVLDKDPSKVRAARSFLGNYLQTTVSILEKAQELNASEVDSPAADETRRRADEVLPKIEAAFEAQLAKLMESDLLDLDVEIKTLETVFRSENLQQGGSK